MKKTDMIKKRVKRSRSSRKAVMKAKSAEDDVVTRLQALVCDATTAVPVDMSGPVMMPEPIWLHDYIETPPLQMTLEKIEQRNKVKYYSRRFLAEVDTLYTLPRKQKRYRHPGTKWSLYVEAARHLHKKWSNSNDV